ncbi:MAG TPA: ABC transporter ATP-binding protein [Ktedonobacterales bacterium]|jgi:ABC-2 type transport system ATP-binding protein
MTDTQTAVHAPANAAPAGEVVVRLKEISKRYGARLAVDRLSLEVKRGAIYGFLGPNGAGKTTTIRMLLGLIAPTGGAVELLGEDMLANRAHLLPQVGALVEQPALYPYMNGRDNLRAVAAVLGGVPEARVQAVLSQVGLQARQKDRVRTYSLGMKQRLGVAIALLQDPRLLVLDEPANGLDPAGIVEMRDLLRELAAAGKTIFISSHVLSEVRQICTRVAIINHGRLVKESTVEALTAGTGEFAVTVERPEAAVTLLRAQPWGASARIEGEQVISGAPEAQGRALNVFLVQAGYAPERLTPYEHDLEQVFLQLTGGAEGHDGSHGMGEVE